ncbi:MAG: T9SS type A sorting domain-containing protein [Flavobacterium sp.]|nr:T9SS type A sorting domain-containing protein [Flavobacterium sp.]
MCLLQKNWFYTVIIFCCFLTNSYAGNIYVATTGSDSAPNDGTIGKPYLTINKAAQVAVAGDVVIIKSGTYMPTSSIVVANEGTSSAPFTFMAEVKDGVIIDGTNSPTPNSGDRQGMFTILGTTTNSKSWIVVDGLRVINSKWAGIYSRYSDNIIVKNCSTNNTWASGIIAANSSNIKVLNNKVQQACMHPQVSPKQNTNECITMASVATFEVAYNTVSDRLTDPSNGGEGIDAKNACTNGTFHHNTVTTLTRIAIYIDAFSGNLSNVEVYANKVSGSDGGGITIASESGGVVDGVKLHDNLIYNNKRFGIRLAGYLDNGPLRNVDVYQNTIVNCGFSAGSWENVGLLIEATNATNSGFNIRNNIISGCPFQIRGNNQTFPVTIDRNLLFGATVLSGTNVITLNPLFVNAAAFDFRLASGSPAINVALGSPLSTMDFYDGARPIGLGSDLGAFEFNPALSIADNTVDYKSKLNVFPNPANELINVNFESISGMKCDILLYDLQGRLIYKSNVISPNVGMNTYTIKSDNFDIGTYILTVSYSNGFSSSSKILIQ